jgi:hypothetical protein
MVSFHLSETSPQRADCDQISAAQRTGQTPCRRFNFRCFAMESPILITLGNLVPEHPS